MTTFDPVGWPDGFLSGWVSVADALIGKDQSEVPDRFVCCEGSGTYVSWWSTKSLYQTPVGSRADMILTAEFVCNSGGQCGLIGNANSTGSSRLEFFVNDSGSWELNSAGGNIDSGSGTGITTGVSFDLEMDCTTSGTVIGKVNGSTIFTRSGLSETGLYGGIRLTSPGTMGVLDIGPPGGGGGATYVAPKVAVPRQGVQRASRW